MKPEAGLWPGLPHLYRVIIAGRGDLFAIGCPCHREDYIFMTLVEQDGMPGCCISYANRVVIATCGDFLAIGRPRQCIDLRLYG